MKILSLLSLFLFSSAWAGSVSSYEVSSIEVTPLGSDNYVKVGRFAEFGKFRVSNRSESNKKIVLQSLRLRNYGKADLNLALENPGIYVGNELVSTGVESDDRYITFSFQDDLYDGYELKSGNSTIFSIRATLAYARTGDSIEFGLQYPEDLEAIESSTGFQVEVADKFRLKTYTLNSGNLGVIRQYYKWYRYNFRR